MDIVARLKPIGDLYSAGDFTAGLRELEILWAAIPEPQPGTPNAYLVVEYGAALSLKAGELDLARQWADRAPRFAARITVTGAKIPKPAVPMLALGVTPRVTVTPGDPNLIHRSCRAMRLSAMGRLQTSTARVSSPA